MIYGDQIRLRHVERGDLPQFVMWLNDPEVRHGLALRFPLSMAEEENWFEAMLKRPIEERSLVIEVKQGDVLVDPNTALAGEPNEELVEDNIERSFELFEDDDHDGEHDELEVGG